MSYNAIVAGAAFVRIAMDDASLRKGLKEAQKRVDGFAKSWEVLKNKMALNTSGAFLYFANAIGPLVSVLQTYSRFSDQMLMLKAISGATQSQIAGLEKYIRHLGATTAFTADQVAKGAVELSRMGFSTGELKAGLKPALDLVRATGQETFRLGEISAYAASALRIFGLKGKDFADVCDVMAYAANASNADIDDLGEALKIAGPSARTVNEDLRDTAAALMLMSNAGIKGSLAGTSLRKIYQSLAAQSGKTAGLTQEQVEEGVRGIEAMRNLGVKIVDPDTGNLRKAAEVMNDLAVAVKQFKSGEKINFATEVFDLRGSLGALSMLNDPGLLNGFRQSLENVEGYAAKTAQEAEKGIGGLLRVFISRFMELNLVVGKMVAETFTPLLQAGAVVFEKLAVFVKENQVLVRFFGSLAAAGLTLGGVLKILAVSMDVLQSAFTPVLKMFSKINSLFSGKNQAAGSVTQKADEASVVQRTERLKELAQQKSDAIRIASEQRRHYMVLKNAAAEAQAVTVAEARKLAASKARIAELSSMRFDGQSIGEIAAMSPEAQSAKFGATRDYYGANRAREQVSELQQLQAALNGQQKAYEASVAATKKASGAARNALNITHQSTAAAKKAAAEYFNEALAQNTSSASTVKRTLFLAKRNAVELMAIGFSRKHCKSIMQQSIVELVAAKKSAQDSALRVAGYYAVAAGAKTAATATTLYNAAAEMAAANKFTIAIMAIVGAWQLYSSATESAKDKVRQFYEEQEKATEQATKKQEAGNKQRKKDRVIYQRIKQLEELSRAQRLTAEQMKELENYKGGDLGFDFTLDKVAGRVKTISEIEFVKAEQARALERATNRLTEQKKQLSALEKKAKELKEDDKETARAKKEQLQSIREQEELIRRIKAGDKNAIVGEEADAQTAYENTAARQVEWQNKVAESLKTTLQIEEELARLRRTSSEEQLHQLKQKQDAYNKEIALQREAEQKKYDAAKKSAATVLNDMPKRTMEELKEQASFSSMLLPGLQKKYDEANKVVADLDKKIAETQSWIEVARKTEAPASATNALEKELRDLEKKRFGALQTRAVASAALKEEQSDYSTALSDMQKIKEGKALYAKYETEMAAANKALEEINSRSSLATATFDEQKKRIEEAEKERIEKRRNFSNEIARQNAENDAKREEDKTIDKYLREGNREAAIGFLQQLLETAKEAYSSAKNTRESAFDSFMEDSKLSDVEKEKLSELEKREKEANDRLQDYRARLADVQDSVDRVRSTSLGSFSFDALKGMFGNDSAAERTANATEEQVRLQKKTQGYMKSMVDQLDLSYS